MKHLIPEFEKLRERFPEGFEHSLRPASVRRIQKPPAMPDFDVEELTTYLGIRQESQIEDVTHRLQAQVDQWFSGTPVPTKTA